MEVFKHVEVVVPLVGEGEGRRRAILDFLRVRHLIERRVAVRARGGADIRYWVTACEPAPGSVTPAVAARILDADVVIGLVDAAGLVALRDLGQRGLVGPSTLLVVRGDPGAVLPPDLRGWPHVRCDTLDVPHLEALACAASLLDPGGPVPDDLRAVVDAHGGKLRAELALALQRLESSPVRRPRWSPVAAGGDFAQIMAGWVVYYPCAAVRFAWRRRSLPDRYLPKDMDGPAVVAGANDSFWRLHAIADPGRFSPAGPDALTVEALLDRLGRQGLVDNLEEVRKEHERVTDQVVLGDGYAWVTVPLRFNGNHPFADFRWTAHLPLLVAKRISGDPGGPHRVTYLLLYVPLSRRAGGPG